MNSARALWLAALLFFAAPAAAQTAVTARGDAPIILASAETITAAYTAWGPIRAPNYRAVALLLDCTTLTGTTPTIQLAIQVQEAVDTSSYRTILTTAARSDCDESLFYMGGGVLPTTVTAGGEFESVSKGSIPVTYYVSMNLGGTSPSFTGDLIVYPIPGN